MRVSTLGVLLLLPVGALAQENSVSIAMSSDVPTLDASMDSSPVGYTVHTTNIFDQLTQLAPDGTLEPGLATDWTPNEDATEWTFTIRSDAKFHNGEPVTIDDVVWSFEKIMAEGSTSPIRPYLRLVDSIEKVGEDKIRFNLATPFSIFPRQLILVSVLPRAAFEEMGAAAFGQNPVGSGPYRLVEWVKDDRIVLEAFSDYWAGAPALASATFRPIPNEAARVSALLSGEVDVVAGLPSAQVERLKGEPNIAVKTTETHRVVYLGMNTTLPGLDDLKLRQAIDMAIDRTAITTQLLRGLGTPAGQITSPANFGYDPTIEPTTYDPEMARNLVAESSYTGEPIAFLYPSNNLASADLVAQAIASYLQQVGINVQLQGMEYTAFFPLWANRQIEGMYLFAYGSALLDADSSIAGVFETGGRAYEFSPEIDALAKQQRSEVDPDVRRALIREVWDINKAQTHFAFLYNEVQAYGVAADVSWEPSADGFFRLYQFAARQ